MNTTHHPLIRHGLAMHLHLQHDNARLREAISTIAHMAEHSTSAMVLADIARLAHAALVEAQPANPSLTRTGA